MNPSHPVRLLRHVRIPMRDGVHLSAHITRPDAEGRFPAVIEYTPYHKGDYREAPYRYRYLAERGYVVVNFDVRGTGDSEGITTDMYQPAEQRDGYDVVEWCAAQPWCNGSVGMWGISYCGVVCWQVAMQAPPHLKAIIVRSGTDDVYTEWTNPGGSPRPYIYENYAPLMTAYNFAPPNPDLCGERWSEMWQERLEGNVPWGIGYISHLLDGEYWRERSVRPDYDRVRCAVFVIDGWADWYFHPLLRAFSHLKVPKRALMGPWSHMWPEVGIPGPRIDGLRECARWFDHFLKGVDTGVMDEPPVALFVREYTPPATMLLEDNGFWRAEHEWPLARGRETPLYLGDGGRLQPDPPTGESGADTLEVDPTVGIAAGKHGGGPFPPWGMPLDQRLDEVASLTYTTPPLEEDLEVTGVPHALLHVSSTADTALFVAKLCDVAPDGTSALVTKGYLNATHRNSHTHPEPLVPEQVYALDVELLACAYRFAAGHRVRLDIAGADLQNVWPTPKPCVNTVHRGGRLPSRLVLPVAPAPQPALPAPEFAPSPFPLPERHQVPAPEYSITQDLVNETTTVRYTCRSGSGVNTSAFTVSRRDPARAVVQSSYEYVDEHPGRRIVVRSQCVTSSDEAAFHHVVDVEITVNGRPHWNKGWSVSVPRRGA